MAPENAISRAPEIAQIASGAFPSGFLQPKVLPSMRPKGFGRGYTKGDVQAVTQAAVLTAVTSFATEIDATRRHYHLYKALIIAGAMEHALPAV